MAGTHRERIGLLESRLDVFETGMLKLEKMMEQVLKKRVKKGSSSSSSEDGTSSDGSSTDIQYVKGDERRKGKPKIMCPIFNGTDPIS